MRRAIAGFAMSAAIGSPCLVAASPIATPAVAAVASAPPTGGDCGGARLTKPNGSRWVCSFDEEFSGASLDRRQWTPQLTSNSNFTTGVPPYRACYVDSPKTISVSHGYLHLSVVKTARFTCQDPDPLADFSTRYAAGEVTTYYGFAQTYGRFEVRAKLPQTAAKGLQETLWLWPKNDTKYGSFPGSGEIDF